MNIHSIVEFTLSAIVTFTASALLTGLVRKFALTHGVLDLPNNRSSHTAPTPRGGGVAIVLTLMVAISLLSFGGAIASRLSVALLLSGGAVAAVGFFDDKWEVAASVRLTVHIAAVSLFVWSLGRLPPIDFGIAECDLGIFGPLLGVLTLVWFVNLYNFMDGIDAIAGVEAMSVATAAAALLMSRGAEPSATLLLLLTAAATGGFLIWNWPPARIFMGDTGSGFLGFLLGSIAWVTVLSRQLSVWVWLILYGAFFVDATVTLLRRWGRGEALATAHRSHAYQRLSRKFGSHQKVTLGYLIVNIAWLDPLAWIAAAHASLGALLTLVAWTPLAIYSWRCGAGLPDDEPNGPTPLAPNSILRS